MKYFFVLFFLLLAAIGCSTESSAWRQTEQSPPRFEVVPAIRGVKFLAGKVEIQDVVADDNTLTILLMSRADTALTLKCRFVWLDMEQREIRKGAPEWFSLKLIPHTPTPLSSSKPARWASGARLEVCEDKRSNK